MTLLLHTCCAPCLIFPLDILKQENIEISAYFYNPNIHPFTEFKKRRDCLVDLSKKIAFPLIVDKNYGFLDFSRKVVFNEENRCKICYHMRLEQTVVYAKENGFSAFSSTLLYSKFQKHSLIIETCKKLATYYNIDFFYRDFRKGWQRGIDMSIADNLYRQSYCGCIYSEQERYDNRLKKQLKKKRIKDI